MEIRPKQPSMKRPAEWFTGDVWIDTIARGEEPSRIRVSAVRFTPGARTEVAQRSAVLFFKGRLQQRRSTPWADR